MKHLFFGIEQVSPYELSECLAEAKIFTIHSVLKRNVLTIVWVMKYLWSMIAKKTKPLKPNTINDIYEKERHIIEALKPEERKVYIIDVLAKRLKCKVAIGNIDDDNSAKVTKKIKCQKVAKSIFNSWIFIIYHTYFAIYYLENA